MSDTQNPNDGVVVAEEEVVIPADATVTEVAVEEAPEEITTVTKAEVSTTEVVEEATPEVTA